MIDNFKLNLYVGDVHRGKACLSKATIPGIFVLIY